MARKILFSTQRYQYLKERIRNIAPADWEDGQMTIRDFPDGEHYHRITSNVSGKEAVLIGGTIDDKETLELFDIANGCIQNGALCISLVIPYFGYSTMERAVKYGEIVKAKNRAILFSALPTTSMGAKVVLIDLHVDGISYYFESNIRPVHLYGKTIVRNAALEIAQGREFVMASTDAGRAKWVESLANDLHVSAAFVFKKRLSGEETDITGISANVQDKLVIIYDDMIRTGGSLLQAAGAYRDAGAASIAVITTHGIFAGDGFEKIRNSGLVEKLVCTDTHPNALQIADPFLEVKSVAPLILGYFQDTAGA
ncbi:ribose-phosphate diphosphokinase [Chitinophaga sp. GCM10012297]|uniref:ribose-phosphate diphosphokinase n=1 Tax=Chitinophaga chungangae TaxID=2821488 RepID=A0ABS3YCZ5_9BACT|nr:ribose-phosphate diphosphokinase [Chitinophaga chungangae]MBO9152563.1 ribose-phosphate pyrophosphokinase [Chitinophaga chungangae]